MDANRHNLFGGSFIEDRTSAVPHLRQKVMVDNPSFDRCDFPPKMRPVEADWQQIVESRVFPRGKADHLNEIVRLWLAETNLHVLIARNGLRKCD